MESPVDPPPSTPLCALSKRIEPTPLRRLRATPPTGCKADPGRRSHGPKGPSHPCSCRRDKAASGTPRRPGWTDSAERTGLPSATHSGNSEKTAETFIQGLRARTELLSATHFANLGGPNRPRRTREPQSSDGTDSAPAISIGSSNRHSSDGTDAALRTTSIGSKQRAVAERTLRSEPSTLARSKRLRSDYPNCNAETCTPSIRSR